MRPIHFSPTPTPSRCYQTHHIWLDFFTRSSAYSSLYCHCCVLAQRFVACLLKSALGARSHVQKASCAGSIWADSPCSLDAVMDAGATCHLPLARCAGRWPTPPSSCTAGPWKMVCRAIFQYSVQGRWQVGRFSNTACREDGG